MPDDGSTPDARSLLATSIDLGQVMELLEQRRYEVEPIERSSGSRLARREAWSVARSFSEDERDHLLALIDRVGLVPLPDEVRDLEQSEVSAMMAEALAVREAEDALKGRYEAIRTAVFNALNVRFQDSPNPEYESGVLIDPVNGKKFTRIVKGGKPVPDWSALQNLVAPDVWQRLAHRVEVTTVEYDGDGRAIATSQDVTWRIQEDALVMAIRSGEVSIDHLAAITSFSKQVPSMYIHDLTAQGK